MTISIIFHSWLLWIVAIALVASRATEIGAFVLPSVTPRQTKLHLQPNHADDAMVGKRRQQRKNNVDAIVANLGLQPASSPIKKQRQNRQVATSPPIDQRQLVKPASEIDLSTQLCYARNGHAVLRNFIEPNLLKDIRKQLKSLMADEELLAWKQKVQVASNSRELAASCQSVTECQQQLAQLGITSRLPFLQYFNTWRKLSAVQDLAYALAESAAVLLDVPSVRLYQDSVFWKRLDDGPTPWHADARMVPFDTSHFITFWIPLQDIPRDGTALLFSSKSHADFALPYWNPIRDYMDGQGSSNEWDRLDKRYSSKPVHYMPMTISDVTVHSGWTLHCADGTNGKPTDRMALAISYVDAKAQIRPDALDDAGLGDNEDRWSYQDWVPHVKPRRPFQHDLVPIVWPR